MYYSKVRKVKSPERGTSESAGIDFFVPEFDDKFVSDLISKNPKLEQLSKPLNKISLGSHQRILIPSGIHVNLQDTNRHIGWDGIALIAHNKSGVATKKGLDRLAEVVDEDYQGEMHISIVNTSDELIFIEPNDKLIQFLLVPVSYSMPKEIPFKDLYTKETERGEGGFGSTNKK